MAEQSRSTPAGSVIMIGLVLSVFMVLLGSIRFARFDWTGIPLDRGPINNERRVGPCLEKIHPFTTESGRVIKPVVVDEMQYMAMVRYYRGDAAKDLPVVCMYSPFAERVGVPWLASRIPGDEAVALAVVNSVFAIAGMWFVLGALRHQGIAPLPLLAAGLLYAVSWNTLMFSSGILVDGSVVAAVAAAWYLIARKWIWLVPLVVFFGVALKETSIIIVPVICLWALNEYRKSDRPKPVVFAPAALSIVAYLAGTVLWHSAAVATRAAWGATPTLSALANNLTDIVSLVAFALGAGPLLIPAYLVFRRNVRATGWIEAVSDPATCGVLVAVAVSAYAVLTADLSPRLFWIGYPFAASLTAQWFSQGRPAEWLDARTPRWVKRSVSPDGSPYMPHQPDPST